jgi:hypothetical protein
LIAEEAERDTLETLAKAYAEACDEPEGEEEEP